MDDALRRIAEALEALVPGRTHDASDGGASYAWRAGQLIAVQSSALPLALLTGIDAQKSALVDNLRRHARGHTAHDILLWGARGSGKSALVKAGITALRDEGLAIALVELASGDVAALPQVFDRVAGWASRIVVFIDDIGFDDDFGAARAMRSVLDGGSAARPANVRLAVTSNRRHVVARDIAEQSSAINVRDVVDDRLALADRFGLSLGFHVADQPAYLDMVAGYARAYDLPFDPADAVQFATHRGSRSGRVAWHYIVEIAGRAGRSL